MMFAIAPLRRRLQLLKISLFGIAIALVLLILWNLQSRIKFNDQRTVRTEMSGTPPQNNLQSTERNNTPPHYNLLPSKIDVHHAEQRDDDKKFLMAFDYWEQLTMATNSLIHLTALAAHGGRQVVIPFVQHSKFYGTVIPNQTLSMYYNVSEFNRELQLSGHGTLVSRETFRDVCKDRLDVLVQFQYDFQKAGTTAVIPCRAPRQNYQNLKVSTTTCVYAPALHSVEKFETEIARRHACVGIAQWRGNNYPFGKEVRAHFNFTFAVTRPLSFRHVDTTFFNVKLKNIAQDFIARNLRPGFISIHLRAERIFFNWGNLDLLQKCLSKLTGRAHDAANALDLKVFLSTDFSRFGSDSRDGRLRSEAKSLMELLGNHLQNPITFQPTDYALSDHGAVAIVEMNILAAGRHLFLLGGGSFQEWIKLQFLKLNNYDLDLVQSFCKMI